MLVTIPFVMMILEIDENFWVNVRFWSVVAASWVVVWFAVSYGA
jgi:hypothetical protein